MNIKVKTSLRIILIGTVVLPLVIVALLSSFQIFGFSEKMASDESSRAGYAYSAGVDNLIAGYLDSAKTLSSLTAVRKSITDLNSVKDEINTVRESMKKNQNGVLDIAVIRSDGMIVNDGLGSDAGVTFFAFNKDVWDNKPDSVAFATSFFTAGGSHQYDADVFATACRLNGENGYAVCVIDAKPLMDYLARCTYLNDGFMCVTDNSLILNFNSGAVSDLSSAGLSESIRSHISGNYSDNFVSIDDPSYFGACGKIAGTDWTWLSLYAVSAATNSVFMIFIISLGVMVGLAVVCSLVMVAVTQSVINPMLKMIETMKEINSGNREQRIETNGMKREFAWISDTFNNMMDEALLSSELHMTVSDLSDNMLFEYDFAKETMFVSNNFKEKIGLAVGGATLNNGKFIDSMMSDDGAEQYKRDINTLLKNKDDIGGEYEIKDAKGQPLWVAMRAHCITDRLGEILRVIGVLTDINAEKNATLKLAERASYDFLSQLYNRNTFEHEFQAELERNTNKKVAILFLDVDDFKFINDRYNHAVGDEVIRYVADTIKKRAGETGFAGRFGGDEFVLCVSDPRMIENVEVLSMDIIDDLYSGYYSKSVDTTLNIKASIGIAVYPVHAKESRTLIACADTAMYFVKKNGKANYHIYDPSDEETTMGAHTL